MKKLNPIALMVTQDPSAKYVMMMGTISANQMRNVKDALPFFVCSYQQESFL